MSRRVRQVVMMDAEVHALLHEACRNRSISDFVQDAVVNRLKSWESPAEFILRKREKLERSAATPWPADRVDALGYPRCVTVFEPLAEITQAMVAGGENAVRVLMQRWWDHDPSLDEYSDSCLQATLREWEKQRARQVKKASRRNPAAEQQPAVTA